ncbi:MAG: hypothetical protein Alpg2KO_15690 [Alphaproteobacteria bacterium]
MLRPLKTALIAACTGIAALIGGADSADAQSRVNPIGWGELPWQFTIDEKVRPGQPPQYVLNLHSTKIFDCANVHVKGNLVKSGEMLTLVIGSYEQPYVCRPGKGPAHASFDISLLNGAYTLHINDSTRTDSYRLIVDSAAYMLSKGPTSPTVALPTSQRFWKRPRASFAVNCDAEIMQSFVCSEFEEHLYRFLPDLHEIHQPKRGYWPYPAVQEASGNGRYTHPTRYYVFNNHGDLDKAGAVLGSFVKDHMKGVHGASISIHGHNGDEFHSWLAR